MKTEELVFVIVTIVLVILAVIMTINQQKKKKRESKKTIPMLDMDIFMSMQFAIDNAETILNNKGRLYPMALLLYPNAKTDYYNWQNDENSLEELNEWLKANEQNTNYSIIIVDEPEQSRIIIKGSLKNSPTTEINALKYTQNEKKYKIDRSELINLGYEKNYLNSK